MNRYYCALCLEARRRTTMLAIMIAASFGFVVGFVMALAICL